MRVSFSTWGDLLPLWRNLSKMNAETQAAGLQKSSSSNPRFTLSTQGELERKILRINDCGFSQFCSNAFKRISQECPTRVVTAEFLHGLSASGFPSLKPRLADFSSHFHFSKPPCLHMLDIIFPAPAKFDRATTLGCWPTLLITTAFAKMFAAIGQLVRRCVVQPQHRQVTQNFQLQLHLLFRTTAPTASTASKMPLCAIVSLCYLGMVDQKHPPPQQNLLVGMYCWISRVFAAIPMGILIWPCQNPLPPRAHPINDENLCWDATFFWMVGIDRSLAILVTLNNWS